MKAAFRHRFQVPPTVVVRAPGRINLIGEHTDYNDGFVFPAAIDKAVTVCVALSGTGRCEIVAHDWAEEVAFDLTGGLQPQPSWARYVWGMLDGLGLLTSDLARNGFQCVFGGDIPPGAGLSSSAALCTGIGLALNELYGLGLDRTALAKIAQRAEREFAGVNCGLMDQYASLFGREGHFLQLDCRDLSFEYVPADLGEYRLLLCDSRVKHALADSAYNRRRAECAEGLAAIQLHFPQCMSLRDATLEMLQTIDAQATAEVYARCKYVLEENTRVQAVAQALCAGDLATVGACMHATHRGLRDDYAVSCAELDFLVDLALDFPDVLGARLMGGGFGGCTLNLIHATAIARFQAQVRDRYTAAFGIQPLFYEVNIADGGQVIA
jgi:galactokinase